MKDSFIMSKYGTDLSKHYLIMYRNSAFMYKFVVDLSESIIKRINVHDETTVQHTKTN